MTRTLSAALAVMAAAALALTGGAAEPKKVQTPGGADVAPPIALFGVTASRNMANFSDKNIPAEPKLDGPNMLWKADLGSRAYGGPTILNGKVLCGTNNEKPRNPRDSRKNADGDEEPLDRGVLMCFDAKDGKFLWQAVHNKHENGNVTDWPKEGVCSTPTIEGDRAYYVSNRCTVVCVDMNGRANGVQGKSPINPDPTTKQPADYKDASDADVIWEFDMMRQAGVFPHNMSAGCPLIVGDILYTVTGNGVDEGHINIPAPGAPSFIALDKNTGKVVWRSSLPGKNIMHGQWSNPVYADVKGVRQIIFPGGDGIIYSFRPETGDLIWKFDGNPKGTKYELGGTGTKSDFIGTPVLFEDKIYIGTGQDPEHYSGVAHFWCIDPSKARADNQDLTPKNNNFDPKAPENKDSGLVWYYGGPEKSKLAAEVARDFKFGRTMSTACIVDGILYIAELRGDVHCIDARTGKKFWQYDTKGVIWGSCYYADGKVYVATESGDLFVFKHDAKPESIDELDNPDAKDKQDFTAKMRAKQAELGKKVLLHKVEFDAAIRSTPVVAEGKLFVMTEKNLYAFQTK